MQVAGLENYYGQVRSICISSLNSSLRALRAHNLLLWLTLLAMLADMLGLRLTN